MQNDLKLLLFTDLTADQLLFSNMELHQATMIITMNNQWTVNTHFSNISSVMGTLICVCRLIQISSPIYNKQLTHLK